MHNRLANILCLRGGGNLHSRKVKEKYVFRFYLTSCEILLNMK